MVKQSESGDANNNQSQKEHDVAPDEPQESAEAPEGFTLAEALDMAGRIGVFGEPGEFGPHFFVRGITLVTGEDWHAHYEAHYQLLLNYADDVSEMSISVTSAEEFEAWRSERLPAHVPWLRQMAVPREEAQARQQAEQRHTPPSGK